PFWLGEAPARSNELSASVARLREEIAARLGDDPTGEATQAWAAKELGLSDAAAPEDNIILSLTSAHSFELAEAARYLHSASVRNVLVQALLDAPMFKTRWRWVAGISLALPRFQGGKRIPPQFARM